MITPRRTRLIRVPDLHASRRAIARLALGGPEALELSAPSRAAHRPSITNPPGAEHVASMTDGPGPERARLVIVPTRSAGLQLCRTIARAAQAAEAGREPAVLPECVTRDRLYDALHARLAQPPRRLLPVERDVMIRAAAAQSIEAGTPPPFDLRSRIVGEVGRFYDQLRRQAQSIARFDRILAESLERDIELDRGAGRMLQQTRFLTGVYERYERRLAELGSVDEHALRELLIRTAAADPVRHIVVTVGDWIAERDGLFPADFDLLARLPGLEAVDLVATQGMLASGFHERLHHWLPDIDELDWPGDVGGPENVERPEEVGGPTGVGGSRSPVAAPARAGRETSPTPALMVPERSSASAQAFVVYRDREEELVAIARRIRSGAAALESQSGAVALERIAVVFKRPLPYLYLAREIFSDAQVPYQTYDALPLAAEPFAAAFDLVLDFVASRFTRPALVALLGSPHFELAANGDRSANGQRTARSALAVLNRRLSEARYLGGLDRLRALASEWESQEKSTGPERSTDLVAGILLSLLAAAAELEPLLDRAPASHQLFRLAAFVRAHSRAHAGAEAQRHQRIRQAILDVLGSLAAAYLSHGDRDATIDELSLEIRRWIEDATIPPDPPVPMDGRLQLLGAEAARYGDFDDVYLIGLIEGEWPEPPSPSIFFPRSLLAALGWPSNREDRSASTAAFIDLVRSASLRAAVSAFALDDERLVEPSLLLEELERVRLPIEEVDVERLPDACIFPDEALSSDPPAIEGLNAQAREWTALRLGRTAAGDPRYHGAAGARPRLPVSVSALETYLACPFKFFARHVLRLAEETEDDEVMDPKAQGRFVHKVFQAFFAAWQAEGHRAITPGNLGVARRIFASVVDEQVAVLPEAEAALERTRFLGSAAAVGLADIVFRMEAERPIGVVERLLEYPLEGEFDLKGDETARRVSLRGIADRLDLLEDGTIRLIDYKLSSPPPRSRALQLPIYGICAEQQLSTHGGRRWMLGDAYYLGFRGPKRITPLFTSRTGREDVLRAAQARALDAVDRIERGEFPPTPDDVFLCGRCAYAAVCRKDYVGDV